jgi:hypothetical protein
MALGIICYRICQNDPVTTQLSFLCGKNSVICLEMSQVPHREGISSEG